MTRKIIVLAIIVVGVFVFLKAVSLLESEEGKIRRIIYAAKEATEKENILKCMSFVSYAYNDKEGNNKAILFRIAQQIFKVYDNILIEIKSHEISVADKSNAYARLVCFGQGKRKAKEKMQYVLDMEKVEFDILFRKDKGRWLVVELRFIEPENFMQLLNQATKR